MAKKTKGAAQEPPVPHPVQRLIEVAEQHYSGNDAEQAELDAAIEDAKRWLDVSGVVMNDP